MRGPTPGLVRALTWARIPVRAVLSVLLAALAGAACGGESAGRADGAHAVRDSAGIRIVEADWERMPVLDTVEAAPAFTVGGEELALNRVRAARLLPGGRIAVGHGRSPEVVLVDSVGEVIALAEEGDGPGELGSVAGLHVEGGGERLGVYDPARRRYAVFDLDGGGVVEERSLRDVWPGRGGPAVTMWAPPAFLPAGGDAFYAGARADVPESRGTDRAVLPLLRVRGSRVDTVTRYRGHEFYRSPEDFGPLLLGARVTFAVSPAGVWVGDTGAPSVARWSAAGPPALVVRWTRDVDRRVTETDVLSVLDRIMEQIPAPQRPRARAYAERLPSPDSFPAYGDLLVDDRGVLWVGEHYGVDNPQLRYHPDEPREWALFAEDGTPRGRVVTPPRVDVLDVRSGRVLGLHRDELGVESVRVYRLDL